MPGLRENRIFRSQALEIPEGLDGLMLLDSFLAQLQAKSDGIFTLNIHRGISHVAELLPECKVIHMLRDPRDVGRSSIGMGWAKASARVWPTPCKPHPPATGVGTRSMIGRRPICAPALPAVL